MFCLGYTLTQAMSEMRFDELPILDHLSGSIEADHPIVIAQKKFQDLIRANPPYAKFAYEQYIASSDTSYEFDKLGLVEFGVKAKSNGIKIDGYSEIRTLLSVVEALANAIEHGSNYGERGVVTYELLRNEAGVLAIIEDPGEGFDPFAFNLGQGITRRGRGGAYLGKEKDVSIGIEHLTSGFRMFIFYGKE